MAKLFGFWLLTSPAPKLPEGLGEHAREALSTQTDTREEIKGNYVKES